MLLPHAAAAGCHRLPDGIFFFRWLTASVRPQSKLSTLRKYFVSMGQKCFGKRNIYFEGRYLRNIILRHRSDQYSTWMEYHPAAPLWPIVDMNKYLFIKSWKTSAVSTAVWMVETQLCKLCGTSDTICWIVESSSAYASIVYVLRMRERCAHGNATIRVSWWGNFPPSAIISVARLRMSSFSGSWSVFCRVCGRRIYYTSL